MQLRFVPACVLLMATLAGCASRSAAPGAGEDLRELARFLEAAHPRPYAYTDAAALDALVEQEADRLDALPSPDDLEVGLSFHRVLARLGDGHLAVALPIFQNGAAPLPLLPLLPKRIGATVYVDAATIELPRGTELIAIDGVAIDEIWSALEALVLVDASAPTARRAALERGFARHYHLAYGVRPSYQLRLRRPGAGEIEELTVTGVDRAALATLAAHRHSAPLWGAAPPDPAQPPWPFLQRIDVHTVLLRMPSFGISDQAEYARRVDEIFAGLTGPTPADTLLLDVRGNEGGLRTHGIAVLNHVLSQPYAQWSAMAARVLRVPEAFRARVAFPYVPEAALAERFAAAPQQDGRRVFPGDPLAERMKPRGAGYPGRVIAFVDGATASASAEMIASLRAFRADALLVGEESGSECRGHVGELPVLYTSAARGIVVLVSLIELTHVPTARCQDGHGFAPDVAISYDAAAFLAGRDPFLDAVAALPQP